MPVTAGSPIVAEDFMLQLDAATNGVADHETRLDNLETNNPRCRVSMSAPQTIANVTGTDLVFDTESWDVGPIHSGGGAAANLIAPLAGIYEGVLLVVWAADATGVRLAQVVANGSTEVAALGPLPGTAADELRMPVPYEIFLGAGDYLRGVVYQDGVGGGLNASASMTMRYVGTTT